MASAEIRSICFRNTFWQNSDSLATQSQRAAKEAAKPAEVAGNTEGSNAKLVQTKPKPMLPGSTDPA